MEIVGIFPGPFSVSSLPGKTGLRELFFLFSPRLRRLSLFLFSEIEEKSCPFLELLDYADAGAALIFFSFFLPSFDLVAYGPSPFSGGEGERSPSPFFPRKKTALRDFLPFSFEKRITGAASFFSAEDGPMTQHPFFFWVLFCHETSLGMTMDCWLFFFL